MVLQKRLDYGFNGYNVPIIPRAPRSTRKRISIRKKDEVDPLYAFDLLATVAGKLLLEDEFSPASIISTGQDQYDVNSKLENLMKVETIGQSNFFPEISLETRHEGHHLKDFTPHQNDALFELPSVITTIGCSEKVSYAEKSASDKTKNEIKGFACKEETSFSGFLKSSNCKLDDETKMQIKAEPLTSGKMPLHKDRVPCSSFPPSGDVVNIVSTDDDENSSMCTYPSTTFKSVRPPPRVVDRKLKKILASKYWKVAPRLKDEEVSNASRNLKPIYCMRKTCYERQRSPRNYPFKKRRLGSSISNCRGIRNGRISRSFQKGLHGDAFSSVLKTHGANGALTSAAGQNSFLHSRPRDSNVKLRINSFRVPEFFIEMPETATVGSLKRRVMEAISTILGGGLRVGVLLQEKKVKDDNKTLLQTGITHDNRHDAALGFALEPESPLCTGGVGPSLLPADASKPLTWYLPHQGSSSEVLLDSLRNNLVTYGDHDSSSSPTTMMSIEKRSADSKTIEFTPTKSVEALSMIPMHRKSNRSDASQRRIRRPFSVTEVEALVQAVEKLGTGRWRDVKSRAFDNAKHRTYVDLKDKWKTLVHTARIAPQQRRGEPVPQILLDRVLAAHSYWTQHAAKLQLKNQSDTCFLI